MTMELGTMNAEELDCSHRLEWEYHEALRQGKNVPPPPTDVRLTLKRWLEAVEEFVQAYPGAIVLSADRADYRMLGMVAYTQDETHVLNVYLPISVLHPNPRSPWNRALRRRDFAENLRQGEVLSVELP